MRSALLIGTVLFGCVTSMAAPASAATCRDPAGFDAWLGKIKQEAIAQGISASAVDEGLSGVQFDQGVLRRDHGQGVFRQSFEQFSQRMVPPRLGRARALEQRYADVFRRIDSQYGVSAPILLAIWGLETDFGATHGSYRVIQSIATLAYDCRRSEMFKAELFDALRMVQSGVSPEARGAWAGEIGQTQFMPSTYIKYAVGGRDLDHSVYDVLASTANFLRAHGWQRGAGWGAGRAELCRHPGVEQVVGLLAHDRLLRDPARRRFGCGCVRRRRRRRGAAAHAPLAWRRRTRRARRAIIARDR